MKPSELMNAHPFHSSDRSCRGRRIDAARGTHPDLGRLSSGFPDVL